MPAPKTHNAPSVATALAARLTVNEAAAAARKHPVTIRRALEGAVLHGTQQVVGGRWTIRAECLDAWLDGAKCAHRRGASNVVPFPSQAGASA